MRMPTTNELAPTGRKYGEDHTYERFQYKKFLCRGSFVVLLGFSLCQLIYQQQCFYEFSSSVVTKSAGKMQEAPSVVTKSAGKMQEAIDPYPPIRPFYMPIKEEKYEIFQPLYDMNSSDLGPKIFAPFSDFLQVYSARIELVRSYKQVDTSAKRGITVKDHVKEMYLEMMKSFVVASVFGSAELSASPTRIVTIKTFDPIKREDGKDWTYLGDTMTGNKRIKNVMNLLTAVLDKGIPGDYIETGVWRGGSSVYAKAVLVANGDTQRRSYVCDSFAGLPPGDKKLHEKDIGWDLVGSGYLEVPAQIVAQNFQKYNLLDENIIFAKGFFNETMPVLAKKIEKLSVMRLDGDMYESTVDVLYQLYDKLSIGGYLIMDDWFGFPSKTAVEDFFAVHGGIQPEIIAIDTLAAYWQKTEQVEIQHWRYAQSKFKPNDVEVTIGKKKD